MESRMDKYNNMNDELPKRCEMHKDLYTQVYNAYDEFENLVVPSNSKEIDINDIQKEITKREDYHSIKDYKEPRKNEEAEPLVLMEEKQDDIVLDIKEMLNKAVLENQKVNEPTKNTITNAYLKKLNLEEARVNEPSEEQQEEQEEYSENEELLKTANFSLDLLSDLKGENDDTKIAPPIKDEFLEEDDLIENKEENIELDDNQKEKPDEQDDFYDNEMDSSGSVPFLKILGIVFGLILLIVATIYLYNYVTNAM